MGRTYIIAEAGVNHNGSIDMAKQLIDVAAKSGADAVKFQTFQASHLVTKVAPKANYQNTTTNDKESQYEMLKNLELTIEMHEELMQYCKASNIEFLSTPFDEESVDLLVNHFQLSTLKISSGEITNAPLLLKVAKSKCKIILSTGMSTIGEIEQALSVIAFGLISEGQSPSIQKFEESISSLEGQQALQKNVTLLHCTTEYPAPFTEVNLNTMDTLKTAFQLPVGYSDHTEGFAIPIAAVAKGAIIVEKHFTLDKNLPGPDHRASLEPHELKQMIQSIREVEVAMGSTIKIPTQSELKNKKIARKSIVAKKSIKLSEEFTTNNLSVKRPGTGLSPMNYYELLGKKATKSYIEDELINE